MGLNAAEELVAACEAKFNVGFDFATILSSPFSSCILFAIRAADRAEILGAAHGAEMPDIEQMKKIVPLITCEIPFSEHVCEFMFGVNIFDCLGPCLFCQTTNPEQLCGSVKHASL